MKLKTALVLLLMVAVVVLVSCRQETPAGQSQKETTTQTAPAQQPQQTTTEKQVEGNSFPAVGSDLPVIALAKLDGSSSDLRPDAGKVVLVNLWATWCAPCRAEIPDLEAIYNRHKSENFEVIGISVDSSGTEQNVRDFVGEQKMTYPVLLDPEGKSIEVFKTSVIPTSVLVDRNGKVVWFERGTVNPGDAEFKTALETALKSAG